MQCKKLLTLASYIKNDENALICDFAEYYHIYDYKRLPARYAGILASGLRDESRSVMSAAGHAINPDTYLLATISDELQIIMYQQRAAAGSKRNTKPKLITEMLENAQKENEYESFDSPEDFELRREQIIKGG